MPQFQTGTSFSWEVISQDEAIKRCDKTVFNDRQTGIPKEKVKAFFEIENLSPGEEQLIQLEMSYLTYPATISVETRGSERAKLRWGKDLGKILETYENNPNCWIRFEKRTPRYYRITMIIDESQPYTEVDHSLETYVDVTTKENHVEGKQVAMYVTKYERDPKNRAEAIRIHGTTCQACGFDFAKTYGKYGEGYIEVHHVKPLYSLKEEVVINPETDLVCVCSNCHKMLHHKRNRILTIAELHKMIKQVKE